MLEIVLFPPKLPGCLDKHKSGYVCANNICVCYTKTAYKNKQQNNICIVL